MTARIHHDKDGTMKFEGVFRCPHCGHENSHWFGIWANCPEIVTCDSEEGGCDTYFAVTARVDVTVTVTPRKIEGIEPGPFEPVEPPTDYDADEGEAA
jgi:hypothetical protein